MLCHAAVAVELGEGVLDDPSAWEALEANGFGHAFDDIDAPAAEFGECFEELVAGTSAVGEEVAQPREGFVDGFDDEPSPVAVLDVGGVDYDPNEQTSGIGHDMSLAALHLLGRIVAAGPAAFARRDRLAVDDTRRRARFRTSSFAHLQRQHKMGRLKQAVVVPIIKVALHSGERRKVLRQQALLTACRRDVQNAVEDHPKIGLARPAQGLGGRYVGFNHRPFGIGEVSCIALPHTPMLCPSDFSPHLVPRRLRQTTAVPELTETTKFVFGQPLNLRLSRAQAQTTVHGLGPPFRSLVGRFLWRRALMPRLRPCFC